MDRIHTLRERMSHGTKNLIIQLIDFLTFPIAVILGVLLISLFFVGLIVLMVTDEVNPLKMDVTDASLTQFDITTTANDTLHYSNLALNITLRNPNKYFRIYYETLVVADYRNHRWFGTVAEFHQPEKNTTWLKVQLNDNNITDQDVADAGSPNYYNIVVKFHLGITYKSIPKLTKDRHWISVFTCYLKVPLKINGSQSANMTTSAFETTNKCQSVHYVDSWDRSRYRSYG